MPNLFLVSEVRAGSTAVAETIAYAFENAGFGDFFGLTRESLATSRRDATSADLVEELRSLPVNPAGWRCVKVMATSLSRLWNAAHEGGEPFGPDDVWLVLRRQDRVAQAVSLARARQTDDWHNYGDSPQSALEAPGHAAVLDALHLTCFSDVYLEALQTGGGVPGKVLPLTYEEFFRTPSLFVARIASAVGQQREEVLRHDVLSGVKLKRSERELKSASRSEFINWFMPNHHDVSRPPPPASRSTTVTGEGFSLQLGPDLGVSAQVMMEVEQFLNRVVSQARARGHVPDQGSEYVHDQRPNAEL